MPDTDRPANHIGPSGVISHDPGLEQVAVVVMAADATQAAIPEPDILAAEKESAPQAQIVADGVTIFPGIRMSINSDSLHISMR